MIRLLDYYLVMDYGQQGLKAEQNRTEQNKNFISKDIYISKYNINTIKPHRTSVKDSRSAITEAPKTV